MLPNIVEAVLTQLPWLVSRVLRLCVVTFFGASVILLAEFLADLYAGESRQNLQMDCYMTGPMNLPFGLGQYLAL